MEVIIGSARHYEMEVRENLAAIYGRFVVMLSNEINHKVTKPAKEVVRRKHLRISLIPSERIDDS